MIRRFLLGLVVSVVLAGCDGKAHLQSDPNESRPGDRPGSDGSEPVAEVPPEARELTEVASSGMHRLTRDEYDNTLRDLLGDTARAGSQKLPEDVTDPFDNDYVTQQVSGALVDSLETLAGDAAARALADPSKRDFLVQCTPKSPGDAECLRKFITTFGRRALRQTLTEAEIQKYLGLQVLAIEANDFYVGVELVMRALLQDPRFLYRVEVGFPLEGKSFRKLTSFEMASRLSYFLWGTMPPDWLLDLAEADELLTPEQVRAAAEKLFADDRARERMDRFHALWLGYHQLPHSAELTAAMRKESAALMNRIVFEQRADYFDMFTSETTFVNDLLAGHYGLTIPGTAQEATWVGYGDTGRRGILSHGSVLSQGAKFSDTSPTQRGIWVRSRLLCEIIAPPPSNANADQAPESTNGSNCKKDRYASHANVGSCATCHSNLDGIGWGLEQYDSSGRLRSHDDGDPNCPIDGKGDIPGYGPFSGPAELAGLLMDSGKLERCITTQMYRFAHGRREAAADWDVVTELTDQWKANGRRFDALVLGVVTHPTFGLRRNE